MRCVWPVSHRPDVAGADNADEIMLSVGVTPGAPLPAGSWRTMKV